jgi:molybdopterin converting factor small subunit
MKVRLVISGRSYHAANELPDQIELPDGSGVEAALKKIAALLPADNRLPDSCLVAVAGTHLGTLENHRSHALRDGDELTLIAPVAGG